eukprot:1161212-Pelagomonas_calceolata.AAC.15
MPHLTRKCTKHVYAVGDGTRCTLGQPVHWLPRLPEGPPGSAQMYAQECACAHMLCTYAQECACAHMQVRTHTHRPPRLSLAIDVVLQTQMQICNEQVAREGGGFKLRQRAEHVFEEAKRVLEFKAVCDVSVMQADAQVAAAGS